MPQPAERWAADLCGGRLQTFCWETPETGERLVRVWTPPGWTRGAMPLALWLNDGQNLFRDEDAFGGASWGAAGTVAHLIAAQRIPPILLLGIDHRGPMRTFDYLSVPPTGWDAPWGQGMRGDMWDAPGGGVETYMERVISELLPWAEQLFGVAPEASQRYFGGSSFGGICALYMAMRYPDHWAGVLVESPSFWAGNGRYMADVAQNEKGWPKRMYLAMGEFEYTGFRGTERPGSLQCDAFLREALVECAGHLRKATALLSYLEPGGRHNERDWGRRLPMALRWLLSGEEGRGEAFWTRPSPLLPGSCFELLARKDQVRLPDSGRFQVHLGFDQWSSGVRRCDLLPSGLGPTEGSEAVLAALAYAPSSSSSLHFAFTNGVDWDNNQEKNYELPVGR
ncbi:unnamed protein product [Durusdinium trenchii]|uniref:Esterase n=1 Tax=Durusdinium trenchii TaxID=1381693 RepID=A0ABP0JYI2_9DINO